MEAREKLVGICISLKEAVLLQLVFGRWASLQLVARAAHSRLAIFASLEQSRRRLTELLYESHRENRLASPLSTCSIREPPSPDPNPMAASYGIADYVRCLVWRVQVASAASLQLVSAQAAAAVLV